MKQSKFLSIGRRDLLRSLLLSVIACVLTFAQETLLPALDIPAEIKLMINYALAYLIKNFFTKPDKIQTFSEDIVGDHPPKDGGR